MGSASSTLDQNGTCSNCDLQFTKATRKNRRICLECKLCMCPSCLKNLHPENPPSKFPKLSKRVTTGYCVSCTVMLSEDPTDQQLTQLKVKQLKGFLTRRSIPEVSSCVEKKDLVELILASVSSQSYRERRQFEEGRLDELLARHADIVTLEQSSNLLMTSGSSTQAPGSSTAVNPELSVIDNAEIAAASAPQTAASGYERIVFVDLTDIPGARQGEISSQANQRVHPAEGATSVPTAEESPRVTETRAADDNSQLSIPSQDSTEVKQSTDTLSKISLSEIESISEIDDLSVKQLKIILTRNLVTYRGCKEKHELINRVKMLWQSRQDNERLYQQLLNPQVSEDGVPVNREEPELCKICMDSAIDCVLLDCGHMVTCTKCGKQMNECPICRQFVIRAVHIFRA